MKSKIVLSVGLVFLSLMLSGQTVLRGKVTSPDGKGLLGASIYTLPSFTHTTSIDTSGYFQMPLIATDSIIAATYPGYAEGSTSIVHLHDSDQDTVSIDLSVEILNVIIDLTIVSEPPLIEAVSVEQVVLPTGTPAKEPSVDRLLNTVPGVYMQSGSLNTNRLTIRGNGNRSPFATSGIKVYIDNIPVHENSGNSALEDFGTHLLTRAQILKGPTGPSYGSGLSGGVIIDTDTRLYQESSHLQSYTEAGAYGTVRTANTLEINTNPYASTPHQHLRVQHSYTHTDGYRANNRVDRQNVTANYRLRHKAHTLKVLANVVQLDAQIPGALNFSDYTADPRQAAAIWQGAEGYERYSRALLGATYVYNYGLESKATITAYGRGHASEELRPFNTIRDSTGTVGLRARADHFISIRQGSLQLTAGYDLQSEQYDFTLLETEDTAVGDFIRADRWQTTSHHAYLNTTLWLDSGWNINLGQEYAAYTTETTLDAVQHNAALLPVLTVTRQLPWTRAYAKVSRGATFPAAEQFVQNQLAGALPLRPEFGWNYEMGLKGYAAQHNLGYRLAVYHMRVTDQLVQRAGPDDTPFLANGGSSLLSGVEWSLQKRWKLDQNSSINTSIASAHTLHRFDRFAEGGAVYDANQLPGSPAWTLHATANYEANKIAIGIAAHHVSSYAINDGNTAYNAAYTLLSTTADYYLIKNDRWKLSIHARGENLTNRQYASMTSINARSFGGAPRYYYGGLPANFSGGILLKYQW